jgi:hypothetical protein
MARFGPSAIFCWLSGAFRAHNGGMTDVKPHVEFEPVDTRTGAGWQVRASLATGKQVFLGSFNTELEAREWIARKSEAWLHLKACEVARSLLAGATPGRN